MTAAPTLRILSLGGGTQSSVLAVRMADNDLAPRPDHAIFADTGNEPPSTLRTVEWLADRLPYPVHIARAPLDILTATRHGLDSNGNPIGAGVPMFTVNADGSHGQQGRWCTDKWKRRVVTRKIRDLLGVQRGRRVPADSTVEVAIGYSVEEIGRMSDPEHSWMTHRYPLIDARLSRHEVRLWWEHNAPDDAPPLKRSACVICPYHSDAEWLDLQDDYPHLVEQAARAEQEFHDVQARRGYGHVTQYMHASRIPLLDALDQVRADRADRPSLFDADCGGYCGL